MEVILTVRMNLGDTPADAVTLLDRRRVPWVGSVFDNRDRIARGLLEVMVGAGLRQPATWKRWLSPHRRRGAS